MPSAVNPPRLLITGASGFLGDHLCRQARTRWEVYGIWHQRPIVADGVKGVQANLSASDRIDALLREIRPDAVIHAAARSVPDDCENHPDETRTLNVTATEVLARVCGRQDIPFVFTSTDLIFDGTHGPYAETDPVGPISEYGRQKAAAERRVREQCPQALICRLPLLIGACFGSGRTFSVTMLESLMGDRPVNLFVDEFRTPVDGHSAAAGILNLIGKAKGVVHLGGRTRLSRHALGRRLADLLGHGHALLRPVSLADIWTVSPRPADVSLDSRRAYALGYTPSDIDSCLHRLVRTVCENKHDL